MIFKRLIMYIFHSNSLIQNDFSDVSTTGCLLISVISQTNFYSGVYFSHWGFSFLITSNFNIAKQSFRVVLLKSCSSKFHKICRKIPVLGSLLIKLQIFSLMESYDWELWKKTEQLLGISCHNKELRFRQGRGSETVSGYKISEKRDH